MKACVHDFGSIFQQKALILLSIPAGLTYYIPASLIPHLDELIFVLIGWILAVSLSVVEYFTSVSVTKKRRESNRSKLFVKIIIFTFIFFFLKFFHFWILFEKYENFAVVINMIIISIYALICMGEFKFIGQNIESKYGIKPSVFRVFESLEEIIKNKIIKKTEKVCNLNDKEN